MPGRVSNPRLLQFKSSASTTEPLDYDTVNAAARSGTKWITRGSMESHRDMDDINAEVKWVLSVLKCL